MSEAREKRLIVSMTSYPARIQYVPAVVASLLAQTKKADRIVIYLSSDQFPGQEADLPEALRTGDRDKDVFLCWVEGDLKPHKKYFYAFREFPEDIVVTVDDDVEYPREMLESFWETHLQYPKAVVAGRTHVITLDENGEPNPYSLWLQRTMGFEEGPSMQLHSVGVGGVLYDPSLFPPELYDEEAIRALCLEADDLWLKAMELAAGIPVVRAATPELVRFVDGSQEISLYKKNVDRNLNDPAFRAIREWMKEKFGTDVVKERLNDPAYPAFPAGDDRLMFLNLDRKRTLETVNNAYGRQLNRVGWLQNSLNRRTADLEKAQRTITRKNADLNRYREELARRKEELERKREELTRRNEEVERRTAENARLIADIESLRKSASYRIGNVIIRPLALVKKLLRGGRS